MENCFNQIGFCDFYSDIPAPVFPNVLPQGAFIADALTKEDVNYIESVFDKFIDEAVLCAQKQCEKRNSFVLFGFGCACGENASVCVEKCDISPEFKFTVSKHSDIFNEKTTEKIDNSLTFTYKIKYSGSLSSGEYNMMLSVHNIIRLSDGNIIWCDLASQEIEI